MRVLLVACLCLVGLRLAALETRVYAFTNTPPEEVETTIRGWVAERQRVLVNPERGQVMVVADAATHGRIAQWLRRVDRPTPKLLLRVRQNREWSNVTVTDGAPGSFLISTTPPEDIVKEARERLGAGKESLPVAGASLQFHTALLRENPATARLRVTPAVVFGRDHPYEVVVFDELSMDVVLSSENYLDLPLALSGHTFYPRFFRTQPEAGQAARPVGLLLSLKGLSFEPETLEPEKP
jgi:hypothetical protein